MIFIKLIKVYADLDTKNKYYKIVIFQIVDKVVYPKLDILLFFNKYVKNVRF